MCIIRVFYKSFHTNFGKLDDYYPEDIGDLFYQLFNAILLFSKLDQIPHLSDSQRNAIIKENHNVVILGRMLRNIAGNKGFLERHPTLLNQHIDAYSTDNMKLIKKIIMYEISEEKQRNQFAANLEKPM